MPQIKLLHLRDTPNDTKGMEFLASLDNLEELMLEDVELTAQDFIRLQDCTSLRYLYFYETSVDDGSIVEIAKLKELRSLCFIDCELQHTDLGPLRDLRKLKFVNVRGRNFPKSFFEVWRSERHDIEFDIKED